MFHLTKQERLVLIFLSFVFLFGTILRYLYKINPQFHESVNFIDVGVKLYVTPPIHDDDYITMKIKPEVSSVTRFVTTGNNNTIPVVETSQAETTVMVKNGVTIVIGGLIKDEKIDSVNKIPILGDLPILGAAFRNKNQLLRKTELVIFLTPQIISGDTRTEEDASSSLKPRNE